MREKKYEKKIFQGIDNHIAAKQYDKVPATLGGEAAYEMTQVKLALKARD